MSAVVAMGSFAGIGDSIGVIVGLPGINGTPENHYAVCYGGKSKTVLGVPSTESPRPFLVAVASG